MPPEDDDDMLDDDELSAEDTQALRVSASIAEDKAASKKNGVGSNGANGEAKRPPSNKRASHTRGDRVWDNTEAHLRWGEIVKDATDMGGSASDFEIHVCRTSPPPPQSTGAGSTALPTIYGGSVEGDLQTSPSSSLLNHMIDHFHLPFANSPATYELKVFDRARAKYVTRAKLTLAHPQEIIRGRAPQAAPQARVGSGVGGAQPTQPAQPTVVIQTPAGQQFAPPPPLMREGMTTAEHFALFQQQLEWGRQFGFGGAAQQAPVQPPPPPQPQIDPITQAATMIKTMRDAGLIPPAVVAAPALSATEIATIVDGVVTKRLAAIGVGGVAVPVAAPAPTPAAPVKPVTIETFVEGLQRDIVGFGKLKTLGRELTGLFDGSDETDEEPEPEVPDVEEVEEEFVTKDRGGGWVTAHPPPRKMDAEGNPIERKPWGMSDKIWNNIQANQQPIMEIVGKVAEKVGTAATRLVQETRADAALGIGVGSSAPTASGGGESVGESDGAPNPFDDPGDGEGGWGA